uniref:Uncharacterized protein n=1 Tax=Nephroselmis olivacea TaxID=31312 RepID=Q9TKX0_NEPOL|nr:hypothetical protein NeolCp070 [Nephroselmis olivacea]AAD54846.1 unknown [Nephroselmis olivacea]
MDLTHRLYRRFKRKPLYSIIANSVPEPQRPLVPLDLQEIRWLKTSIDRKEGNLSIKREELRRLEARPVGFRVFCVRVKEHWRNPLYITGLFAGYVKASTKLQFWPFWADSSVKKEIRDEFIRRFIYKLSLKRTSDWDVFKQVIASDIVRVSNFRFQRDFFYETVLQNVVQVCNKDGLREDVLVFFGVNAFIYALSLSPWHTRVSHAMPLFEQPTETVQLATVRLQETDLSRAFDQVVRVEISHSDVVMEMKYDRQISHAYWGDPTPSTKIQTISSFQPRPQELANESIDIGPEEIPHQNLTSQINSMGQAIRDFVKTHTRMAGEELVPNGVLKMISFRNPLSVVSLFFRL